MNSTVRESKVVFEVEQLPTPLLPPTLMSSHRRFKILYAFAKHNRDTNPVHALGNTLMDAMYRKRKTTFDEWFINEMFAIKDDVLAVLTVDITNLQHYVQKTGFSGDPIHYRLLKALIDVLYLFETHLKG